MEEGAPEGITYHVDGVTGDNGNDGLTRASAFETIQFAIEDANDGDTVLVWPGQYVEDVDFGGKAITVKSAADAARPTRPTSHDVSTGRADVLQRTPGRAPGGNRDAEAGVVRGFIRPGYRLHGQADGRHTRWERPIALRWRCSGAVPEWVGPTGVLDFRRTGPIRDRPVAYQQRVSARTPDRAGHQQQQLPTSQPEPEYRG